MLTVPMMFSLLFSTACSMANIQQPHSLDEALGASLVKQVPGASHGVGKALDTQVSALFGSRYTISSSRYFRVSADVPWVTVAKNIQNQMLERSITRGHYDGENPGIVPVDFYPQPHGAFVLAADRFPGRRGSRLVGYFVLQQNCPS